MRALYRLLAGVAAALLACESQGFNGYLGLAKETTWGTAVAASDYAEILRESVSQSTDRFDVKNIINKFYEPDDVDGIDRISGDIVTMAHPVSMGHLLKAAMNTVSGSVVLSGFLYTTRFVTTQAEFADGVPSQPYTLEIFRDVTSAHRYAGAICNQLTMALAPNQELRMTAGWIAKAPTLLQKTSPTYPSSPAAPFTFDTASLQIGGAASSRIEALTVSIDNQLEGLPALNNSTQIARIRRKGPQLIRVQGTIDFQDVTEQLDFINQTERAMVLSVTKASSFQFVIDMPRVIYTAFPMGMPGRGRLTVQFGGTARYLTSSATAIDLRLTSTKSDY